MVGGFMNLGYLWRDSLFRGCPVFKKSRPVFVAGSRRAASSCDTAAKGFGALKSMKIVNITRYILQTNGGMFFSEGAEAPQAAATQPQRAWGL